MISLLETIPVRIYLARDDSNWIEFAETKMRTSGWMFRRFFKSLSSLVLAG
jgi:hypothetical protein